MPPLSTTCRLPRAFMRSRAKKPRTRFCTSVVALTPMGGGVGPSSPVLRLAYTMPCLGSPKAQMRSMAVPLQWQTRTRSVSKTGGGDKVLRSMYTLVVGPQVCVLCCKHACSLDLVLNVNDDWVVVCAVLCLFVVVVWVPTLIPVAVQTCWHTALVTLGAVQQEGATTNAASHYLRILHPSRGHKVASGLVQVLANKAQQVALALLRRALHLDAQILGKLQQLGRRKGICLKLYAGTPPTLSS